MLHVGACRIGLTPFTYLSLYLSNKNLRLGRWALFEGPHTEQSPTTAPLGATDRMEAAGPVGAAGPMGVEGPREQLDLPVLIQPVT